MARIKTKTNGWPSVGFLPMPLSEDRADKRCDSRRGGSRLLRRAAPRESDIESISTALGRVGDLAAEIRQRIQASQDAARDKRRATVAAMAVVSGAGLRYLVRLLWASGSIAE